MTTPIAQGPRGLPGLCGKPLRPDTLPEMRTRSAASLCRMLGGTMSAEAVNIKPTCRNCGAALTMEEMHYYDRGNGEATCNNCEREWMDAMQRWKSGEGGDVPPPRP